LLDLPGAAERLSIWKADLAEEGSFDDAIKGCTGVFHVATPMDFESKDPEVHKQIFGGRAWPRKWPKNQG